jgi:hypothetical protein
MKEKIQDENITLYLAPFIFSIQCISVLIRGLLNELSLIFPRQKRDPYLS